MCIYRNSSKSKKILHVYTPCISSEHFFVVAVSCAAQLRTAITVFASANKDIVLYGNFPFIFKNTSLKEALRSYLEREMAESQLSCADGRKRAGGVRSLHRLSPMAGTSLFLPSRAGWALLPLCPSSWSSGVSLKCDFPHGPGGFPSGWKSPLLCHCPPSVCECGAPSAPAAIWTLVQTPGLL